MHKGLRRRVRGVLSPCVYLDFQVLRAQKIIWTHSPPLWSGPHPDEPRPALARSVSSRVLLKLWLRPSDVRVHVHAHIYASSFFLFLSYSTWDFA